MPPNKLKKLWQITATPPARATILFAQAEATVFVTAAGGAVSISNPLPPGVLQQGKEYTVQLRVRATPHAVPLTVDITGNQEAPFSYASSGSKEFTASDEWASVEFTFTAECADSSGCPGYRLVRAMHPSACIMPV